MKVTLDVVERRILALLHDASLGGAALWAPSRYGDAIALLDLASPRQMSRALVAFFSEQLHATAATKRMERDALSATLEQRKGEAE